MKLKELIEAVGEMDVNMLLGFRHGKLETIILSRYDQEETALDCNYYIKVDDPQNMITNLKQFLKDQEK